MKKIKTSEKIFNIGNSYFAVFLFLIRNYNKLREEAVCEIPNMLLPKDILNELPVHEIIQKKWQIFFSPSRIIHLINPFLDKDLKTLGADDVDNVIFFIFRHSIELFFKSIGHLLSENNVPDCLSKKQLNNTHDISKLWGNIIKFSGKEPGKSFYNIIFSGQITPQYFNKLVIIFSKDSGGERFRYSVDKSGNILPRAGNLSDEEFIEQIENVGYIFFSVIDSIYNAIETSCKECLKGNYDKCLHN